jgi:hypothetical protein
MSPAVIVPENVQQPQEQYHSYHDSAVIYAMQDYLDAKHLTICADSNDKNRNDSGSNYGYLLKSPT